MSEENKNKNSPELKEYIRQHSSMFWYIKEDAKEDLPLEVVVEFVLNYGKIQDIRRLFELVGIKNVAKIFKKQISQTRINYFPLIAHYFKLYFERHAH
jgi:hypothetical protein